MVQLVLLIGLALAGGLSQAEVGDFLAWHCSQDNAWRYAGSVDLAAGPAATEHPGLVVDLGPDGVPSPQHAQTLAIDAATPVGLVREALADWQEAGHPAPAHFLVGRPDARPRPPLPITGEPTSSRPMVSVELGIALGPCNTTSLLMAEGGHSCGAVVTQLREDLERSICEIDPVDALAAFSMAWAGWTTPGDMVVRYEGAGHGVAVGAHPLRPGDLEAFDDALPWGEAVGQLVVSTPAESAPPASTVLPGLPQLKKRAPIATPAGLDHEAVCGGQLRVDEKGRFVDIQLREVDRERPCSAGARLAINESLKRWRWTPHHDEQGVAVASVVPMVLFRLTPES